MDSTSLHQEFHGKYILNLWDLLFHGVKVFFLTILLRITSAYCDAVKIEKIGSRLVKSSWNWTFCRRKPNKPVFLHCTIPLRKYRHNRVWPAPGYPHGWDCKSMRMPSRLWWWHGEWTSPKSLFVWRQKIGKCTGPNRNSIPPGSKEKKINKGWKEEKHHFSKFFKLCQ